MANSICINKTGSSIYVYSQDDNGHVGDIYPNELFTYRFYDANEMMHYIFFYSGIFGRWVTGRIPWNWSHEGGGIPEAYADPYSYGWKTVLCSNGYNETGFEFRVRRQCRIFSNTSQINTIYAGDAVLCADGSSRAGDTYSYRLRIIAYRKSGTWHYVSDGWCDTDLEIGYSMASSATTYGAW